MKSDSTMQGGEWLDNNKITCVCFEHIIKLCAFCSIFGSTSPDFVSNRAFSGCACPVCLEMSNRAPISGQRVDTICSSLGGDSQTTCLLRLRCCRQRGCLYVKIIVVKPAHHLNMCDEDDPSPQSVYGETDTT